jgi:hypothetical protein
MVVYEVTATVPNELTSDFEHYMQEGHIANVLATECFTAASFETSGPGRYRMRYVANDLESLEKYLSEYALVLRDDFAAHFPNGIAMSREHWMVLSEFA